MIDDPTDVKTKRFSLFLSAAFHCVIAAVFILITFPMKQEENIFVDVQFMELPVERPAPEDNDAALPPPSEQNISSEPMPAPEDSPQLELPRQEDRDSESIDGVDEAVAVAPDGVEFQSSEKSGPFSKSGTILRETDGLTKKFPSLADRPDTVVIERGPLYTYETTKRYRYPDGEKPERPADTWNMEDDRRLVRRDIMKSPGGGNIGNLLAIPLIIGKHVIGKGRDFLKKRKIARARKNAFTYSLLDEKSLRLMILLWRDGSIDPDRLSLSDRKFVSRTTERSAQAQTHRSLCKRMEKNGLVTSSKVSGRTVFSPAVTRNEVLYALQSRLVIVVNNNEIEMLGRYIALQESCYDHIHRTIVIPAEQ